MTNETTEADEEPIDDSPVGQPVNLDDLIKGEDDDEEEEEEAAQPKEEVVEEVIEVKESQDL